MRNRLQNDSGEYLFEGCLEMAHDELKLGGDVEKARVWAEMAKAISFELLGRELSQLSVVVREIQS